MCPSRKCILLRRKVPDVFQSIHRKAILALKHTHTYKHRHTERILKKLSVYTLEGWYHLEINVFSLHFVESSHVFIFLLFQEHVALWYTEDLV